MKNTSLLTMVLIAVLSVVAVSCTTSRVYSDGRYGERAPYGYYDRYYDPYSYGYGYPMMGTYPGRYYGDRYNNRYYQDRRRPVQRQRPTYDNRNRERQQQYEQQRQENTRKIEDSKNKVLGRGN